MDVYTRITDQIVDALERAGEWSRPWSLKVEGSNPLPLPHNVQSHKQYRGINTVVLWCMAQDRGYRSSAWGTYKQWQALGAQVRKGEKATPVVFWKFDRVESDDEDQKSRNRVFATQYNVFNADQVEGYTPKAEPAAPTPAERLEAADAFFAAQKADLRHGGSNAFYAPAADYIQMPPYSAFPERNRYYSTLAHEFTHWTVHKDRCDRQFSARFGDEAYAFEELVAELGAAFCCATLGIDDEPRADHAAYIASWIRVLKNDKRAIFTAATKAQQATDWLQANAGRQVQEEIAEAA